MNNQQSSSNDSCPAELASSLNFKVSQAFKKEFKGLIEALMPWNFRSDAVS